MTSNRSTSIKQSPACVASSSWMLKNGWMTSGHHVASYHLLDLSDGSSTAIRWPQILQLTHTFVHKYVHTKTHHTHTYIHTHIYIYTYLHTHLTTRKTIQNVIATVGRRSAGGKGEKRNNKQGRLSRKEDVWIARWRVWCRVKWAIVTGWKLLNERTNEWSKWNCYCYTLLSSHFISYHIRTTITITSINNNNR